MLFETLSQGIIFLYLSCGGISSGIIFDLKNILLFFLKKNKIISQILMFFACFFVFFAYFLLNLKQNYGQIRFFSIFAFFCGFAIERFFATNFVAIPLAKCYNKMKEKQNGKRKMVEKI